MIHDSYDDVSEGIRPTVAQLEVIDLLELNPEHHELVRLSRTDWRHVDAVRDALAAARAPAVPTPRLAPDQSPAGVQ